MFLLPHLIFRTFSDLSFRNSKSTKIPPIHQIKDYFLSSNQFQLSRSAVLAFSWWQHSASGPTSCCRTLSLACTQLKGVAWRPAHDPNICKVHKKVCSRIKRGAKNKSELSLSSKALGNSNQNVYTFLFDLGNFYYFLAYPLTSLSNGMSTVVGEVHVGDITLKCNIALPPLSTN